MRLLIAVAVGAGLIGAARGQERPLFSDTPLLGSDLLLGDRPLAAGPGDASPCTRTERRKTPAVSPADPASAPAQADGAPTGSATAARPAGKPDRDALYGSVQQPLWQARPKGTDTGRNKAGAPGASRPNADPARAEAASGRDKREAAPRPSYDRPLWDDARAEDDPEPCAEPAGADRPLWGSGNDLLDGDGRSFRPPSPR